MLLSTVFNRCNKIEKECIEDKEASIDSKEKNTEKLKEDNKND